MNFGFYHVSWSAPGTPDVQQKRQRADLMSAAAAGCNLAHVSHLGNLRSTGQLLDVAAGWGMAVIVEDIGPEDVKVLIGHPALLAQSVIDDAQRKPFADVQAACDRSVQIPRYLSHGPSLANSHPELYGPTERVGVQSYPYPSEQLLSSYLVWQQARVNADAAGVQVIGNAQLHSVGGGLPTPEQIRAQVWLAAACNLDGLLGYAQLDQSGPVVPALGRAFTQSCAEVSALTSGRATTTLSPDHMTLTAHWAGRVCVTLDLDRGRVLSLTKR